MSEKVSENPAAAGTSVEAPHGILVAVDGSESSDRSLAWAVREAELRAVPLTITHCYYWPSTGLGAMEAIGFLMEGLAADSADVLAAAEKAARAQAPGVAVRVESRLGAPVASIVEISARYELVVIGSRGLGGFKGMLLGSVSTGVVANALADVVVVRGDQEIDPGAPVVVGVDASAAGQRALEAAFAAAERRGCPLHAVHAWQGPVVEADADQEHQWQQQISDELVERVAAVAARHPSVQVESVTHRDRPAAALLARAQSAQLLVVGTRGRSEFKGMLLGSTSRAMVQHAPCPVMVVR